MSALSDDLLPGWYDDWAVIAAEDWRQLRMQALEAVTARLTAADRFAEAAAAALAALRARASEGDRPGGSHQRACGGREPVERHRRVSALPDSATCSRI